MTPQKELGPEAEFARWLISDSNIIPRGGSFAVNPGKWLGMTTKKNKTVTVKFTTAEAEWLINQLERLRGTAQEKATKANHTSERESYLVLKFQAESLVDRIRSEA